MSNFPSSFRYLFTQRIFLKFSPGSYIVEQGRNSSHLHGAYILEGVKYSKVTIIQLFNSNCVTRICKKKKTVERIEGGDVIKSQYEELSRKASLRKNNLLDEQKLSQVRWRGRRKSGLGGKESRCWDELFKNYVPCSQIRRLNIRQSLLIMSFWLIKARPQKLNLVIVSTCSVLSILCL